MFLGVMRSMRMPLVHLWHHGLEEGPNITYFGVRATSRVWQAEA